VLLNCALALLAAGAVDNVPDGVAAARDSIDSRKARRVLDELVRFSQSLAGERS
jgi:anthranilate phosphoribosyltransferase